MPSRELKIINETGLHARPAAQIVRLCNEFASEISLSNADDVANAKSIMGLMMLAAAPNSTLTATAEGEDADQALDKLEELFAAKFQED